MLLRNHGWNKRGLLVCILVTAIALNAFLSWQTNNTNNVQSHRQRKPSPSFNFELEGIRPRAFPKQNQSVPCFPLERQDWFSVEVQRSPARQGLLYVKIPKASSTTGAGINLRIATRVGNPQGLSLCEHRGSQHSYAIKNEFVNRNRTASILWSIVREPTARMVSDFFYFAVSRESTEPTDENFLNYLQQYYSYLSNYQLRYLALHVLDDDERFDPVLEINTVLGQYDFLGTSERLDESVVALAKILGLETEDVMYMSQKTNGNFDDGVIPGSCTVIHKSFVSPNISAYLQSPAWKRAAHWDELLHQAVNRSLDLTIESLGVDEFQTRLSEFRRAKRLVEQTCGPVVKYPCSPDGVKRAEEETDCLGAWLWL